MSHIETPANHRFPFDTAPRPGRTDITGTTCNKGGRGATEEAMRSKQAGGPVPAPQGVQGRAQGGVSAFPFKFSRRVGRPKALYPEVS